MKRLICWIFGHAPVIDRRGYDSVMVCERCHHFFKVFNKDLYRTDKDIVIVED